MLEDLHVVAAKELRGLGLVADGSRFHDPSGRQRRAQREEYEAESVEGAAAEGRVVLGSVTGEVESKRLGEAAHARLRGRKAARVRRRAHEGGHPIGERAFALAGKDRGDLTWPQRDGTAQPTVEAPTGAVRARASEKLRGVAVDVAHRVRQRQARALRILVAPAVGMRPHRCQECVIPRERMRIGHVAGRRCQRVREELEAVGRPPPL